MQTKVNKTLLDLQDNRPPKSFAVLTGVDNKGTTVFVYANNELQLQKFDLRTENLVHVKYIKTVKEADEDKIKFITTDVKAILECGLHDFVDSSDLFDEPELDNIIRVYEVIIKLIKQATDEIIDQMDYVSWVEKFMEDFEIELD